MLRVQNIVPRVPPRALAPTLKATARKRFVDWSFNHYLEVAHPRLVNSPAGGSRARRPVQAAA